MTDCLDQLRARAAEFPFGLQVERDPAGVTEICDSAGRSLFSGSCDDALSRLEGADPSVDWETFWTQLHVPRAGG